MDSFIYKVEKALSKDSCFKLIDFMNNEHIKEKIELGPVNPRTDLTGEFDYQLLTLNAHKSSFSDILVKSIKLYSKQYPFLASRPFTISPACNLQKYKPGQAYSGEHCENDGNSGPILLRNLAWMFYLNDIKINGGTCFPNQKLTLIPRAGDLYIWPAYWTHSHYGIAANYEEKYILTGWCRYLTKSESRKLANKISKYKK